jgi:DNA-binding winged helix-turn-helix (wHTH) protein
LTFLREHPGTYFSIDNLLREVWKSKLSARDTATVRVTVRKIRKRLGPEDGYIESKVGAGYRWVSAPTQDTVNHLRLFAAPRESPQLPEGMHLPAGDIPTETQVSA